MKRVCVDDVCTSTYRHVPGCTSMYLRNLKFEFCEFRPHPRISLALERYAVAVCSRRAALVYEKLSCVTVVNCMYLYVLVRRNPVLVCTGMYWYVPVRTGTTCDIRFCPILYRDRCIGFQMKKICKMTEQNDCEHEVLNRD